MAEKILDVKGLAELDAYLKTFAVKLEAKILRGAMRAGCLVFADLAKAKVPVKSGALKNSIRVSSRMKATKKGGPRSNATAHVVAGDKVAYYAHMIEFGTASFYTGSGKSVGAPYVILPKATKKEFYGKKRGRDALAFAGKLKGAVIHPGTRPHPFMRPAFDEGTPAAIEAARVYIARRIEKGMKRK